MVQVLLMTALLANQAVAPALDVCPLLESPPNSSGQYCDPRRVPYPPEALEKRIEGVALVEVTVSKTGTAVSVSIVKSSGFHVLDRAAEEWAAGGCYAIHTVNSAPVCYRIQKKLSFVLDAN
ncbi:energy transducer TonB [Pseudomarimonas arenosa]|uniref:Energy transducer TonB n=1 Tax=Pseudomarimonas arenosa TaxID=2774145 RepID=A0AAW3ZS00_9GAMM|nr:energy transducer TonB [Pseudomarimonas arenosa]MBD8528305.1 energy transducer TonB [Pseudomarimonas arenosa]